MVEPTNQSINQSIAQQNNQSTNQAINRPINSRFCRYPFDTFLHVSSGLLQVLRHKNRSNLLENLGGWLEECEFLAQKNVKCDIRNFSHRNERKDATYLLHRCILRQLRLQMSLCFDGVVEIYRKNRHKLSRSKPKEKAFEKKKEREECPIVSIPYSSTYWALSKSHLFGSSGTSLLLPWKTSEGPW